MTNQEHWRHYTEHLFSPQMYCEMGFLYIIAAALQRRVWIGNETPDKGLFPNLYITFVGPPAVGKGLVLERVKDVLLFHKHAKLSRLVMDGKTSEKMPLFPVGGDSTTFAKLCLDIAASARYHSIHTNGKPTSNYNYTPYCFVLPELASICTCENGGTVKLLVSLYDCGDYDNKTKNMNTDYIRRSCLSLLAGTQMTFIKTAYNQGMFDDGFTSRTIFVCEDSPKSDTFFLPSEQESQSESLKAVRDWILKLSQVYGRVTFKDQAETIAYLENWYKTKHIPRAAKASDRMKQYYGRKRAHVQKLAMAFHFAERLDLVMDIEPFDKAINLLEKIEERMEICINSTGKNPLFSYVNAMKKLIRSTPNGCPESLLHLQFVAELGQEEREACLRELVLIHGIKRIEKVIPNGTGKQIVYV